MGYADRRPRARRTKKDKENEKEECLYGATAEWPQRVCAPTHSRSFVGGTLVGPGCEASCATYSGKRNECPPDLSCFGNLINPSGLSGKFVSSIIRSISLMPDELLLAPARTKVRSLGYQRRWRVFSPPSNDLRRRKCYCAVLAILYDSGFSPGGKASRS
jgi:hypothetical protein